MKSTLRNLALAGSLMLVGAAAHADWIDTKTFGPEHISMWEGYTYQHNIKVKGFNPLTDVITGYTLEVDLFDDNDKNDWTKSETAVINVAYLDLGSYYFDLGGTETGWSLTGWAQLQLDGTLDVTVASLWGDFYLGSSTLTVFGDSTSVPEPATLGLLGLGLLGVGFAARRRKA